MPSAALNDTTGAQLELENPTQLGSGARNCGFLVGGKGGSLTHRLIIEWDLTAYLGATIDTGATIHFGISTFQAPSAGGTYGCYRMTRAQDQISSEAWVYDEACWDDYQSGTAWDVAGGDFVSSPPSNFTFSGPSATGDFDLTDSQITVMIQDALDNRAGYLALEFKLVGTEHATLNNGHWTAEQVGNPNQLRFDYTLGGRRRGGPSV